MSQLKRSLKFIDAFSLVVGTVIGTGVFLKAAPMAQAVGSPGMVMLAWFVSGVLSLAGALTYAELGCLFPKAGGEYIYLKEAYGRLPAFLYGWMRFWIASPGSIAAYAVGAATFLSSAIPSFSKNINEFAIILILIFTALNCLTVVVSGKLQSILTSFKILMILGLSVSIFLFSTSGTWGHWTIATQFQKETTTLSRFGIAMIAALWAYDGWNNLPMASGEIENPKLNIPRALSYGMLIVFIIYALSNLSYFYVLPWGEITSSHSNLFKESLPVATKAAATFLGSSSVKLLSIFFVISALGAMNGSILTGARVPYAMANDGLFFYKLSTVGKNTNTPFISVLVQGIISCILALSGSFDQLTDYVVFSSWIFYALVTGSVFIFRKRGLISEYKTVGYPLIPILFILVSILLIANTIQSSPKESFIGILFIASGIPIYLIFLKKNST